MQTVRKLSSSPEEQKSNIHEFEFLNLPTNLSILSEAGVFDIDEIKFKGEIQNPRKYIERKIHNFMRKANEVIKKSKNNDEVITLPRGEAQISELLYMIEKIHKYIESPDLKSLSQILEFINEKQVTLDDVSWTNAHKIGTKVAMDDAGNSHWMPSDSFYLLSFKKSVLKSHKVSIQSVKSALGECLTDQQENKKDTTKKPKKGKRVVNFPQNK